MRIGYWFVAVMTLCCVNVHALEAAAGADTINASQVGINAKIDASTAIIKAGISQVTSCGAQNKIYNPATNTCVSVILGAAETDPVASPIANAANTTASNIVSCGNGNKFYHSNGTCSAAMPPDLSSQVNAMNAMLNNFIACARSGQIYNTSTGACQSSGGISSVVHETCTGGYCQTPACPTGYFLTGCTYGLPGSSSAYTGVGPSGNSCICNASHGGGNFTCTAFCAK